MLTRMTGEKSRRPQFVRIAEFLGLVGNICRRSHAADRRLTHSTVASLASGIEATSSMPAGKLGVAD